MAQFDIHRNTGRLRDQLPFFMVIQSKRFDASTLRVVVPLIEKPSFVALEPRLNPVFRIEGRDVVLDPLQMGAMPFGRLGELIGSAVDRGDEVIDAVDLLISRAHG